MDACPLFDAPFILTRHALQGRQLIHQRAQGSWHGRVIRANGVAQRADIHRDRVLVFIGIEFYDHIFWQVEESRLLDQTNDGVRVLVWKFTKIQLESHSLTNKPAGAFKSNCGHICSAFPFTAINYKCERTPCSYVWVLFKNDPVTGLLQPTLLQPPFRWLDYTQESGFEYIELFS